MGGGAILLILLNPFKDSKCYIFVWFSNQIIQDVYICLDGFLGFKICSFYFESECLGIGVESTNVLVSMIAMYLIRLNIRLILSNTFLIIGNISRTRRWKTSSYFYLKWTGIWHYIRIMRFFLWIFLPWCDDSFDTFDTMPKFMISNI